ncbi:kinesin-like protein KIF18B [Phodopus roborovskii]|uniref:Kinesin-like protein n=1 Tax=Phodopus roborovskii TaxID=109678 RepID=A0AAU9YNE7_PHORO|nr:kinesin-like protein KIF18B [Phodopus roborovskii]CAH6776216.1 Kif18b [Phodopus roborovskii]
MVMAVEDSVVRVVVRVRPPTPRELESQRRPVIQVVDERMLVFDPEECDGGFSGLKWNGSHNGTKKKGKDLTFVFDRVFGEAATQQDVFQHTTHSILDSFLQGYNCSVFAYGATGAGKTHTMLGTEGDPGIMYLTTMELYRRLEARQEEKKFEVLISYLEVYNEQIHDLLEPKGPLTIREDPDKGVVVPGLSFHQPASATQLLEMLTRGNCSRTQHPTDANATSSRSHAIFQIFVKQQDRVPGLTQALQVAKMSLIDLAGSERASNTHAKGERLREGANINRSLLALINVLNALADAKGRKSHVPYRDSKLTRLLKDSIGGNCRTVMIAAISPSSLTYEDTYNTLKYADRAKEIRLTLKTNVISLDHHISQYATICQQLQAEVAALREKLQMYETGAQALQQHSPRSPKLSIPQDLPSSPLQPGHSSQSCTPELHAKCGTLQEESLETEAKEQMVVEENVSDQEQFPRDKQMPEPSLPESPSLTLQPKLVMSQHSPQKLDNHFKQLALRVLCLAQRQYSLLQAANLLTPDMISEFETLQHLVHEENTGLGTQSPSTPGGTSGDPLAQELYLESRYCGPVTRTMAKQLNGLTHTLGIPLGPDCISDKTFQKPAKEKKKKRKLNPTEPGSPPAPNPETKRQRQSFLPCLRRGSLPKAEPCSEPRTPKGERASSHSSRVCPATVIKSRVPLGSSALQNCSTPLVLPTRDLNTTFNISEESPFKPSCHDLVDCEAVSQELMSKEDQPFLPSAPVLLFTTKGPKSSLPTTTAGKKRHTVRSSVSRGRSCIARLPSSTLKKPNRPFTVPEPPLSLHCLGDQRTNKGLIGVTECC